MGITRKLEDIRQDLVPLEEQGNVEGFFNNVGNADKLGGLIEDIRNAIMEYQVCICEPTTPSPPDICTRLCYSKISTTRILSSL